MGSGSEAECRRPKKFQPFLRLFYDEAWSFIYFCHDYEKGKYRERFLEYMGRELEGDSDVSVMLEVFGRENKDRLASEWWQWANGKWKG